ncbi:MAG: restriction endonuclease [Planctomycetota bacterium]
MRDYDFHTLNDKEFEALSVALIGRRENCRVERFKPGPDQGVDGRFFCAGDREVIVQCKHWAKSGFPKLVRELQREKVKAERLGCHRYILATSVDLSRKNKQQIRQIFTPHVQRDDDILGKSDLNDLLADHPDLEQDHYKLWYASTNVLVRLMNSGIFNRTRFKIEDIRRKVSLYAQTTHFHDSIAKLEQHRTVILSGEPGAGKTTLAEQLLYEYIKRGYTPFEVSTSIEEAEDVLDRDTRQIFYFDDFLGRNYFDAINDRQSTSIARFIRNLAYHPSARFILTSRTTILNHQKTVNDVYSIDKLEKRELEIRVQELTTIEKARILYNHLWHQDPPESVVSAFYTNHRYRRVVSHRNFNPRLISFVTDPERLQAEADDEYWTYIEKTLDEPSQMWGDVFNRQISSTARVLVVLCVVNRRPIEESVPRDAFTRFMVETQHCEVASVASEFELSRKTLVGTLLSRTMTPQGVVYDLFNPAIGDFVLSEFEVSPYLLYDYLASLQTRDSLTTLRVFINQDQKSTRMLTKLVDMTFSLSDLNPPTVDYRLCLISNAIQVSPKTDLSPHVTSFIDSLDLEGLPGQAKEPEEVGRVFEIYLTDVHPDRASSVAHRILSSYLAKGASSNDFAALASLMDRLTDNESELKEEIREHILEELCESMTDWIINSGDLDALVSVSGYSDDFLVEYEFDFDEWALEKFVADEVAPFTSLLDADDVKMIENCCERDSIIDAFRQSLDDSEGYGSPSRSSSFDDITEVDDLFDRG